MGKPRFVCYLAFCAVFLPACKINSAASLANDISKSRSTYARYVPERLDDFAWENDLVAFRVYGPVARQGAENSGVDCWLKRVRYPIINSWYAGELEQGKSYHKDWGEGLDNYHVGSSAGCGSDSLWLNGKREPLETYVNWEILNASRQETQFKLSYEKQINGDKYKAERLITLKLGSRLFRVTATYWKNDQLARNIPVAIGVTTHDGKALGEYNLKQGYLAAWETIEGYGLGTGVKLDPRRIKQIQPIDTPNLKDTSHLLFIAHTDNKGQVEYYAGYAWEKADDITRMQQWLNYMGNYLID